jgi:hypothetical protein
MPPVRQRPSAAAAVTKAAIAQATSMLDDLPARPKESWSLREAVNLLQDSITTALSRGYSYEEVTVLLAGKGVDITASSLKRYLATAKKKIDAGAGATTKTRKPRMTKAAKAAAAAAAPAEEAAPKRRGRKPGVKAAAAAEAKPKATRTAAARKTTAASDTTKVAKTRAPKAAAKVPGTRGRKKKIAE